MPPRGPTGPATNTRRRRPNPDVSERGTIPRTVRCEQICRFRGERVQLMQNLFGCRMQSICRAACCQAAIRGPSANSGQATNVERAAQRAQSLGPPRRTQTLGRGNWQARFVNKRGQRLAADWGRGKRLGAISSFVARLYVWLFASQRVEGCCESLRMCCHLISACTAVTRRPSSGLPLGGRPFDKLPPSPRLR